jgi:hypothetical protein
MNSTQSIVFFSSADLEILDKAVLRAEELVNNHFKLSPSLWLKNRYDIKTARNLTPQERIEGPYAQVLKYEGRQKDIPLGSSSFSLYHVCLQDPAILKVVNSRPAIRLAPFLLYILIHELVHVVRFLRFEHRYESGSEADLTLEEERKVHSLTYDIAAPVTIRGIGEVLEFYKKWYGDRGLFNGGKNFE